VSHVDSGDAILFPEAVVSSTIEVPPPMPVPEMSVSTAVTDLLDLEMPELPTIEIAPPPDIPDDVQFVTERRRARHRPVVRAASSGPPVTRPLLPGWGRLMVFLGGLGVLLALSVALVLAIGAGSLGSLFCLLGLLVLSAVLWVGVLAARIGRRIVDVTGEVYERLEVFGDVLREVAPGVVQEFPVNLPGTTGVLDQPIGYSELRSLASEEGEQPTEQAVDLVTGVITSLVGRDDVVLARRNYPVEVRGSLARSSSSEVTQPVLTRRRTYVGPGELEEQIARTLRTDQPMTVSELLRALLGPGGRQRAEQVVAAVNRALAERPPDLAALASPQDALAEFERYREAVRRADPELYDLLEREVRRAFATVAERRVPSSLLDLAQYASTVGDELRSS
jgi:hypothetical protein